MICMSSNHWKRKMRMIKNTQLIRFLIFVIIFQVFSSCKDKKLAFNGYVYKIETKKYGYAILFKGDTIIKQDYIPGIEGNIAFQDSLDALKVLDLVINKLNKNESPTIKKTDLIKLKTKL